VVGDLTGNVAKILAAYDKAAAAGCDVAVFSELAVTGYPPEDLLLKPSFVDDSQAALRHLASRTGSCAAVIGFVDGQEAVADPNGRASNGAAVCANGAVAGVYHKRALPDYGVFDEERYFVPGSHALDLYEIGGVVVGISICEDVWIPGGAVAELADGGAQIILNINASPFHVGKQDVRMKVVRDRIAESGVPMVYVNTVGGQDELVFDGGSFAMDRHGTVVMRARQFAESVTIFDLDALVPGDDPTPPLGHYPVEFVSAAAVGTTPIDNPVAPLLGAPQERWEALVLGTRDYVTKNGFTDICLGLSGGIDSSVVAVIAADALGADHVHTVAMPSRFSSDHSRSDAAKLAANLGCDHRTIPIEPAHDALLDMLAESFGDRPPDLTEENVQSRIRGVLLMALANKFGWLVLTTGNKSELAVGYSTLYGDTAGAFAVVKDVWKRQIYELAEWRNAHAGHDLIPAGVLTKPPSAELRPDQRDDQSLPPYDVLDPVLIELVEHDRTAADLVAAGHPADIVRRMARLLDIAEYKRRQNPPGPKVSMKAFGRDRRMPMTNRYRGDAPWTPA
jgi:NAD+ synthase (glutamine-hydrolysing)